MSILDQCLLDLRLFFYSFFSILFFDKCQVCVYYLKITIFIPTINIGVLASIIIQVHMYTRLLIKCLPLIKYK
jgi:hypothetical protein